MNDSIEILVVKENVNKSKLNANQPAVEVVYEGKSSDSSVKNDQKKASRSKKLEGLTPRPKSARQRQQVVFLQEEQYAEQEEKKKRQQSRLARQKLGCDTIFLPDSPDIEPPIKKKAVKRKSSEGDSANKKPRLAIKGPKPEGGGAGSLKCKKISNDEDCQIIFEWDPASVIAERQSVAEWQARSVIKLFEQENTLPFIARYRKEATGDIQVEKLREIQNCYSQLKGVQEKVIKVLKTNETKVTHERKAALLSATSMSEVEHLTAAFKGQSKKTYAERAKALGLQDPAMELLQGNQNKFINRQELYSFINHNKEGLRTIDEIEQGLQHIIADVVSKNPQVLACIRQLIKTSKPVIECKKVRRAPRKDNNSSKGKNGPSDDLCAKYSHYMDYKNLVWNTRSHEILAMNRGEQQGVLSIKIVINDNAYINFFNYCQQKWLGACPPHYYRSQLIMRSVEDSWERLVKPFMQRQIRSQLTETAEIASVEVFAKNLRKLLLTPPLRGKTVLAIDPGFKNGCKVGVTDPQGVKLLTTTIYPFKLTQNSGKEHWTKDHNARTLREIVHKYACETFVIGNGCGCRETETYISDLIRDNCFEPYNVQYAIIDETGVSQYSVTQEARQELPGLDPNHISAVSLARRLQDPLLEYVKVQPQHLGVGMYQHDIPEKILNASLDSIVTECVSFVGVDVNVASEFVLRKLAGLNKSRASQLVEYRKTKGPIVNREQLKEVKGIGPKTFEQCAGFIKILPQTLEVIANKTAKHKKRVEANTPNPLDRTTIHPESYKTTEIFMDLIPVNPKDIGSKDFIQSVQQFMRNSSLPVVADLCKVTPTVMQTIVEGLAQPIDFDIRASFATPLFRKGITTIDDLSIGTILTGTVRNVCDFGAFVDVGVERHGLIHKSRMGGMQIELGNVVEVAVISKTPDKTKLGLSLKCVLR